MKHCVWEGVDNCVDNVSITQSQCVALKGWSICNGPLVFIDVHVVFDNICLYLVLASIDC